MHTPLPLVDIFLTFGPRVDRSVQKFAMGRRVDRPWTSRCITARDYYLGCMRIECTRTRSHAYRTCTCERGLEQTFLYNLGTRTRWFHEQADRLYYSLVKGARSRSTYGKSTNSHSKKVRMQPTCRYAPGQSYVTGRHGARRPQSVYSPSHGKPLNRSVHPRSKSEENVHKGTYQLLASSGRR